MLKKLMVIALSLVMVLSMMPLGAYAETTTFSDMPDDWSTAALQSAVDNGLLNGANGMIMPEENLTRAQMAAVINRAFGAENVAVLADYDDVVASDWFFLDMAKAVAMGTFQGSGNKLSPNDPITREQAFAVIARALKLGESDAVPEGFTDLEMISDWAKGEVYALVNSGYIQGSNGMLNPQGYITRAEFAQVMHNIIKEYITEPGEVTIDVDGNVMINSAGVILMDSLIEGDIILGDGVGNGEVVFDNVEITGNIIVRLDESVVTILDDEDSEEETSSGGGGGGGSSPYVEPEIVGAQLNGEEAVIDDLNITVPFDYDLGGDYVMTATFNKAVKIDKIVSNEYPGLDISFIDAKVDDDNVSTTYSKTIEFSFNHDVREEHFQVFGDIYIITVTDGTTDLEFTIEITDWDVADK